MTEKAVLQLKDILRSTSGVSSKPTKRRVHFLTGLQKIQQEQQTYRNRRPNSPDFIIVSALAVMEMCLESPITISKTSLKSGLNELVESFERDFVSLCKQQAAGNGDVKSSRDFFKDKSKAHRQTHVGMAPIPSIAEAFLFKPYARSSDFRNKARLLDENAPQSRALARKMVAELKQPRKIAFVQRNFAKRLLNPSYAFLTSTQQSIEHHRDVLETEATIRLRQIQLQRFYKWRNGDRYKQMISAYKSEIAGRRRLESYLRNIV